jgi:hypothetical protein
VSRQPPPEDESIFSNPAAIAGTLLGTGTPACFVQGPIPWHHLDEGNNRYAHIWPFNYSRTDSPATPHDLRPSGG